MNFLDIDKIPDKSRVFIDANIFIYHFAGVSNQCAKNLAFMERHKIIYIVTHDNDFDNIPCISIWKPVDIHSCLSLDINTE